ncbi:MAG: hypothetical protein WCB85_01995 [Candidatus Dormiibacterota bacterium]
MIDRLRWFKRLVRDLPQQLRLAYCLFRDPRVPIAAKAGVAAALGVVLVPVVELPAALPVVGDLDAVAVTLIALRLFVALCPAEVVAEQEQLIAERRSRFDTDVLAGERVAMAVWHRLHRQSPPALEAA